MAYYKHFGLEGSPYGFFLTVSAVTWKTERTYLNFYLMSPASSVGILSNWLLVSDYAGIAAAAAIASYLVSIVAFIFLSQKLWPIVVMS